MPGPQFPLYLLGRRLLDTFPIAFLPENHALAIAIMSYDGGINFGLLADHDSMDDVDSIAASLGAGIDSLLELARHRDPAPAKDAGTARSPQAGVMGRCGKRSRRRTISS